MNDMKAELDFAKWVTLNKWTWSRNMDIWYKTARIGEENESIIATDSELQHLYEQHLKTT